MKRNKTTKWLVTATILCLFCGSLWLYNRHDDTAPTAPVPTSRDRGKPLHVNGVVLRPRTLTDAITAVGNLLPDEEVSLSFETSGKIETIHFREGSRVRKGELLAKVNDRPLQAQLSRYEAQLKLAEKRVYRQSALLEKDAVSQEAYEQARTELAILNADISIVKSNIALTELRAPFDGVIGLRNISEGAYASPSVVVARLTKIAPLKVDFFVPERYATQIRPGTPLTFTVDGRSETFRAMVYATESQIDPTTRFLSVRAHYPNTQGLQLLPGRFANVRIQLRELRDALAVPTEAIVPEMGISRVFRYRNGLAEAVSVETGLRTASSVQILSGLQPGDTIITSGTLQLRTDLPVILDTVD